jgi:hypothetical protein
MFFILPAKVVIFVFSPLFGLVFYCENMGTPLPDMERLCKRDIFPPQSSQGGVISTVNDASFAVKGYGINNLVFFVFEFLTQRAQRKAQSSQRANNRR